MGTTVDSLEIQLQAQAGKANNAIDTLITKLGTLNTSLTKINGSGLSGVANGVDKLSRSMQGLKNVGTADYTRLAKGIEKIANLNSGQISKASGAIVKFGKGLQGLNSVNVSKTSKQVADLANGIARLGYKSSTKAIDNIPKLSKAMMELMHNLSKAPRVSQNLIDMTNALGRLARTGASSGRAANALGNSLNTYTKSTHKARSGSRGLASALGKMYATYWLLFRFVGKIKDSITLASDLVEVQNVVDTVFGDMSRKVEEYAQNSIKQFGMSELSFKQYSSRFQAMGSAMGIDTSSIESANSFLNKATGGYVGLSDSMADVSLTLTQLTADMASFYNVSQKDVAEDLAAIFTGETRPLRQYGLDLTQATLQEWAMKNGLDANIKSMSQAEKTMLRYQYVLANTSAAQGDFARTSNTWANQLRILQEQIKKFASIIGTGFIAAFKPFLQTLNMVMAKVIDFTQNVLNALGQIFGWEFEISGGGVTDDLGDISTDLGDSAGSAGDLSDNLGQAVKNVKKLHTLGIDELNIVQPDNENTGGGGTGTGGSGGGSGTGAGGSGGLVANFKPNDKLLEAYKSSIDSLYELGQYIGFTLSKTLEDIDWNGVYKKAESFGTGLGEFLSGLISPDLFYNLGGTIANSINTALHAVNAFSISFDWKDLGKSLARSLKGFFKNWDAGLTAETFSNVVNGIVEAITKFVETLDEDDTFEDAGQKLVDLISGLDWLSFAWNMAKFWKALTEAMIGLPMDLARGIAQGIIDKIFGEDSGFKMPELSLPPTSLYGIIFGFQQIAQAGAEAAADIASRFQEGWSATQEAWNNGAGFFEGIWAGIKVVFEPVTEWFGQKFEDAVTWVKSKWAFVGTWFSERWEDIKAPFKNVKQWFTDGFQKAYDGVTRIWNGIKSFFAKVANWIIDPIQKAVNGVIDGVNWIFDKVGAGKPLNNWTTYPKFASGSNGLSSDTIGVVNDQAGSTYKELIVPPHGKPFIPEGRNVMLPMEKGTKIMPAGQTKALMNGMPKFKNGIGDFFSGAWEKFTSFTGEIFDYISNPGKIVQIAIDKFTDFTGAGDFFIPLAKGAINKVFDSVVAFVQRMFDSVGGTGIEKAVKWALGIAEDNSHGYDQANRWGNPDYDCSSLVISAFEQAGIKLKSAGATYTGNMYGAAKNVGFADVTGGVNRGNADGMKRGDILLNRKNHTAIYIGNGQVVQASSNENVGIRGGKPGDQTGREIWVRSYYNYPWDNVLRYAKGFKNGIGRIGLSDLIPQYSVGGFPEDGLFMANRRELVGQFSNGQTAVANNYQIVGGIKEGVKEAVSEILAPYLSDIAQNTRETADKDLTVRIQDRDIVSSYDRGKRRAGFSFT